MLLHLLVTDAKELHFKQDRLFTPGSRVEKIEDVLFPVLELSLHAEPP